MMKQKVLAAMLGLCLALTQVPSAALAAEPGDVGFAGEDEPILVQEFAIERNDSSDYLEGEEIAIESDDSEDVTENISVTEENVEETAEDTSFQGSESTISTAAELAAMSLSGNYVLTNDITVTDEWTPIGTDKNPFIGSFDGAGHKITINKVVASGVVDAGLFGNTKNARIKNVDVDITITDAKTAGALVGYVHGGTITSCSATGTITASQKSGSHVGGLLGGVEDNAVITNCYARVDVTNKSDDYYDSCGGFVGLVSDDSTIRCCYATGTVSKPNQTNRRGGFAGFKGGDAQLFSCFFAESTKMSDVNAGFRIPNDEFMVADTFAGWDFKNVWKISSSINGGYPYLSRIAEERTITMKGNGLEADPYIIETEEQLLGFAWGTNGSSNYSACYKLGNDIELTSNYWTPIGGNGAKKFTGTFDGNGHTISGVNFNYNGYEFEGLFGETDKAVIKNVDIEANIAESTKAGALAAHVINGVVSACSSKGTVNSNGTGYTEGGGLIGSTAGSVTIRNCYSTANVHGESSDYYAGVGGLIGILADDCTLTTSYSAGKVSKPNNTNRVGGLVGFKGGDSFIADCFFSAGSDCEDTQAGFLSNSRSMKSKDLYPYWDFTNVWAIDSKVNSGFPYLKRTAEYKPVEPNGLGTKASPYKISSAEELAAVARGEYGTNNYSGYYVLTNDITIPGQYWTPIAGNGSSSFSGVFDGKGHAIKGLTIAYTGYEWQGLFGYINKGTVKNLSVEVSIAESCKAGGITGHQDAGEISSCSTTGSITSKIKGYSEVGGIAGSADGKYLIRNCYSRVNAEIASTDYYAGVGGLVGVLSGDGILATSYAAGKAEKPNDTNRRGGLVGFKGGDALVADCFYDITVSERKEKGAGFGISTEKMKSATPYVYWDFTNVWAMDSSKNNGYPYHTYKKEYQPIELDGAGSTVEPYYITNEQELAAVARGESPKGFGGCYVLEEDLNLSTEYWTPIGGNGAGVFSGEFDGQGHTISGLSILYAGYGEEGLFGTTSGKISNLRVSGKISGTVTTAGLLTGGLKGTGVVEGCAVLGSVEGSSELGGMIGYTQDGAKVSNCYSRANAISTSTDYYHGVGGLIGAANSKITLTNCYANGKVSKNHTNNVSGLVGAAGDSAVVNSCYYSNYSGTNTKNRGTAKSDEDMKLKDTFVDWDFSKTWSIASTENDGYPQLKQFVGKELPTPSDEVAVTGVSLNKETLTLKIGDSETLTATVLPVNATNKKVTWKSSDTSVATVDTNGKVTAVKAGTANVTVTTEDGNKTATCKVTVTEKDVKPTAIALNKTSLSLEKGKTEKLAVSFTPENATDTEVVWVTDKASVATVSEGTVSAVAKGTATITVSLKSDSKIKATCSITVTESDEPGPGPGPGPEPDPEPVKDNYTVKFYIDGYDELFKSATIAAGDTIVDILPDSAEIVELIPEGATFLGWYIDGTSTLWDVTAPVNRNLDLEARYITSGGETNPSDPGSGRDPGMIIEEGEDSDITATYFYDVYMVKGQTYSFPVKYGDLDSASANASTKISWTTSDKSVIKITSGYKAKALLATDPEEDIYVSDKATVAESDYVYAIHIVDPKLKDGTADALKTYNLIKGETVQLYMDGFGAYEDYYDISWNTSDAEIARADDGLITASGAGSAKISAFVNGKAFTCTVKVVNSKTPAKITGKSVITLAPLQAAALKFKITGFKASNLVWADEAGQTLPAYTKSGTLASGSDKISYYQNDVVRITPAGKVTAVGVGTTTLTATDKNNIQAEVKITVPEPVANVVYMNKGKKKNIKYYNVKNGTYNYGSTDDMTYIDLDRTKGKVTGLSAGKALVKCSVDPYNTGKNIVYSTIVFVEDPTIDVSATGKWSSVNAKKTGATLTIKDGDKFVVKLNGTYQPAIFTSNKAAIAFVDEAGVVSARGKGTATLTTRINGMKFTIKVVVQ